MANSRPMIMHTIQAGIQPSELKRYQGQRSRTISANIRSGANLSAATVVVWAQTEYRELSDRFPGASLVFVAFPRVGFGLFFHRDRGALTVTGFKGGVQPMHHLPGVTPGGGGGSTEKSVGTTPCQLCFNVHEPDAECF